MPTTPNCLTYGNRPPECPGLPGHDKAREHIHDHRVVDMLGHDDSDVCYLADTTSQGRDRSIRLQGGWLHVRLRVPL